MAVKLGISLIAWQNDDLPDLTAAFTTEGAMEDVTCSLLSPRILVSSVQGLVLS
jgi:hypothetical protein